MKISFPSARFDEKESVSAVLAIFVGASFAACALMSRKTIEALYKVLGIKAKNLYEGIEELNKKGLIEPGMLSWGTILRDLGNIAAHDITLKIDHYQAESILEFTFGLVEYALRYKPRFEKFSKSQSDK